MTEYTVTAFVNVSQDNFYGYQPDHPLAQVDEPWRIAAHGVPFAAERMWAIGNRARDLEGRDWPSDVRSLSVGDVLRIDVPSGYAYPDGAVLWYACASSGWDPISEPTNIVPLAGMARHTSRQPTDLPHVNYPHYPGRLYDCPACEAACHCQPGYAECIFEGTHNGTATPETED